MGAITIPLGDGPCQPCQRVSKSNSESPPLRGSIPGAIVVVAIGLFNDTLSSGLGCWSAGGIIGRIVGSAGPFGTLIIARSFVGDRSLI